MTHSRAKFWLRIIGFLLILIAAVGTSIQLSNASEHNQAIYRTGQNVVSIFWIMSGFSYLTLFCLFVTGILLLRLRSIGTYLLIISSVGALIICSLPFFFFLVVFRFFSISFELGYALGQVCSFAAAGLVPFVVGFIPFGATPCAFVFSHFKRR